MAAWTIGRFRISIIGSPGSKASSSSSCPEPAPGRPLGSSRNTATPTAKSMNDIVANAASAETKSRIVPPNSGPMPNPAIHEIENAPM